MEKMKLEKGCLTVLIKEDFEVLEVGLPVRGKTGDLQNAEIEFLKYDDEI